MPRSPSTYSLPPGTTPQQPNTVISSSMFNAFADDVAQTFNTVQPIVYGGTGSNDLKLTDTDFGIKDNGDPTKIGQFNASGLPTATTRTYDLPYYSGTLGLVSDIRGQIYGLTLSNNVTDATNDIDIAAGAAVDSTGVISMVSPSTFTKRIDAPWAVGSGNGGLMSAAALTNTTYHVFEIYRPGVALPDFGFDVSPTAPTLPTGYTYFRRIGSILRAGGFIATFTQYGDYFKYSVPVNVRSNTAAASSALLALVMPTGIVARPMLKASMSLGASTTTTVSLGDATAASANVNVLFQNVPGTQIAFVSDFFTNTSAQVLFSQTNTAGTPVASTLDILGWVDTRGAV